VGVYIISDWVKPAFTMFNVEPVGTVWNKWGSLHCLTKKEHGDAKRWLISMFNIDVVNLLREKIDPSLNHQPAALATSHVRVIAVVSQVAFRKVLWVMYLGWLFTGSSRNVTIKSGVHNKSWTS
jgi:hypothetical protein